MVIQWLYNGYTVVIRWLYNGYTVVIQWLYGCYRLNHDGYSNVNYTNVIQYEKI